jgi:SAM-dependent methyltransferase
VSERPNWFGADVAERYDETSAQMHDPALLERTVDLLADLAGAGPALELAVGTGRVALPLARRGIPVHGIDLSPDMLDQLRAKPGGADLPVTLGDIASTRVPGSYTLAYLVWNTIMNLTTQDEQVACFGNAAAHLSPGGRFVVEVMVPQLQRLPPGETARPFLVSPGRLGFDEYDVVTQGLVSHHYWVTAGDARTLSMPFRYAWPAELDLMARLAGMTLEDRWADWDRSPFTADSTSHVSVWRRDG